MKEHEKFIAFCMMGGALMLIVLMLRVWPLSPNSPTLQILNLIVGAFIGGFGASVQKLLQADTVKVSNAPDEPVPTQPVTDADAQPVSDEELPPYAR